MWWLAACVLAIAYSGGGVTQTTDPQLWEDYKAFNHVYGKIFDKDLYEDALPTAVTFGDRHIQASSKKELFQPHPKAIEDLIGSYSINNEFNFQNKVKPEKSGFNFVSFNGFKPISETSDPETYFYLKRLEEAQKESSSDLKPSVAGFKPYANDVVDKPEETYAYKVIQNILDAHEANKGNNDDDDDDSKYLTYREKNVKKNNKRKPPRTFNEGPKQRCLPGRCRKRSAIARVRTRPQYRKITHRIY